MFNFHNKSNYKEVKRAYYILLFPLLLIVSWKYPPSKFHHLTEQEWVDSVFNALTPEQRLGQLFMVAAYSNKTEKHYAEIETLITKNHIGGLIFFQGGPVRQAQLTNKYQSLSKVPLMIGMDAEWGLGMRLDSVVSFPRQMTLGAIQDNKLIYLMGKEVGRQCKRLGVHVNFAPSVDINSNPSNPVIGVRSFGEDKYNVATKGAAYMKGMQDEHVMACAKHFPGHGDTETDSHLSLPVIKHERKRLEEIEFYPFKKLIADSVKSIMVGHIHIPAIDNRANMATTLSKTAVTDLLKGELGFKGLIFTDALNMKGVSSFYKPGEVDVKALLAGNDILLYSENVGEAIEKIQKAIRKEDISEEEVNAKVKKILAAKYWMGLNDYKPIELNRLFEDLNSQKCKALINTLYANAITLVENASAAIPVKYVDNKKFASVSIGLDSGNLFQQQLSNYVKFDHFQISKNDTENKFSEILKSLKAYNLVVIGIHNTNLHNNKDYGISELTKQFVAAIEAQNNSIVAVFGNPYSLKYFTNSPSLVCAFEDNNYTRALVPQLIFGGIKPNGKLPVSANQKFPEGKGLKIDSDVNRFSYGFPEEVKVDSRTLSYVDSICIKAVKEEATPGCQVLIAKEGKVIFNKSYGNLSYHENQPVSNTTLYDIASITKVAGTLQAFMFLEERGLIDLDKKASYYLEDLKGTNKEDLELRDILTHQAGLTPFLPHWKNTVDTVGFDSLYYRTIKSDSFPHEVIPGLYAMAAIEDSLWKWTVESPLLTHKSSTTDWRSKRKKSIIKQEKKYVYSDLGFYIAKRIVESILNQEIEEFLQDNFYTLMGLQNIMYKPLEQISPNRIAPTEDDKYFRKTIIRGNVHDQGAAMLGGVGGHAGLFSNAHDLAVVMQMNLQDGKYGGLRYLLPGTVSRFAERQFDTNRRGLGWDKPEPAGISPTSYYASHNTFGHTGFTGTCVWVDPNEKIVYVFISNRIHKDASNNKLVKLGVRSAIQDVIYKSLLNFKE